jgi:sigma-B regulation protein RsbU (phosphoserine phosphatase)
VSGALSRKLRLVATWALCGLYAAYLVCGVAIAIRMLRSGYAAFLTTDRGDVVRVSQIRPNSPPVGHLRRGDEVVAVAGRGVVRGFNAREPFDGRPPGERYGITIRRDGELRHLVLETIPYGISFASFSVLSMFAVGAIFLATAAAVLALKPDDKKAWLLAIAFALFVGGLAGFSVRPKPVALLALGATCQGLSFFFWPVLLHLFLVFPEPSPILKRLPRLAHWIYIPILGLTPATALASMLATYDRALYLAFVDGMPGIKLVFPIVALVYAAAAIGTLVVSYRQASRSSRRKLRVVVAGTVLGFLPLVAALLVETVLSDFSALGIWTGRLLLIWFILSAPLIPLSFAYAIVRHQVIPVRLIVRRGMRYLLVSRGFYLIEAAATAAAIALLLSGSRAARLDRIGGRADILATLFVGGAVFGLLHLVNRRAVPAIERRFFRDPYDAQRILGEIGEVARGPVGIEDLLAFAAARVEAALHPEAVVIFLWDQSSSSYRRAHPQEEGQAHIRGDAPLVEAMRRSPTPRESELGGLSVPIVAREDVLGILVLGPRLADLPYSKDDRRLLLAVAWQMAFAIENARLVERKVEEQRMRREIALASEVQRRLFPERPPESRFLDLAGLCLPALGVGGDYYDFLALGDGLIGIAVADVAGKGISAALLMSVVQASLRSQAGGVSPAQLVASMNALLYRSAARNRFATFFYAEFDEATRRLTYVNAGHNPPLLLRSAGRRQEEPAKLAHAVRGGNGGDGGVVVMAPADDLSCLRLSTGGLVIGALQATTYEEAVTDLQPGDLLVAYTDGVSEAFDPDGEEFGEDRLRAVVSAAAHLPAAGVAQAVVEAVNVFSHGAAQHDDITLVVAKAY